MRRQETSDPAPGSVTPNAPTLGSVGLPNSSGVQLATWSGVPLAIRATRGRPLPKMPREMPAQPQQSSSTSMAEDAGLVLADHPVEVHAVQADVGRLGQDRPGEVLGLVVVGRDRPDLPLGELAGPLLRGHLVFGEREADHGQVLSAPLLPLGNLLNGRMRDRAGLRKGVES